MAVEAIVKQLKSSFNMLPNFKLTLLEFKTLIDEISTSINNRPLGVLQDSQQPFTPNHLLLGRNFSPVSAQTSVNADLVKNRKHLFSILPKININGNGG